MAARSIGALLMGALLLAFPAAAQTGEVPPRMVLLYASNSMWQSIGPRGETRDAIARRMAKAFAARSAELQPEVALGVVALGHQRPRRFGDCNDIETIVRPLPLNAAHAAVVQRAINEIPSPKGRTPLTAAVEEAARSLLDGGQIVIVSDFDETCEPDPCARMEELRRIGAVSGVAIVAIVAPVRQHRVSAPMRRFAACEGAEVIPIASPDEAEIAGHDLAERLRDLGRSMPVGGAPPRERREDQPAAEPPRRETPPPVPPSPAGQTRLELTVERAAPSLFADADETPVMVLRRDNGVVWELLVESGSQAVPSGLWEAWLRWGGEEVRLGPLPLEPGTIGRLVFRLDPPVLVLHPTPAGPVEWTIRSRRTGQEVQLAGPVLRQSLPPGTYDVRAKLDTREVSMPVTLRPGTPYQGVLELD